MKCTVLIRADRTSRSEGRAVGKIFYKVMRLEFWETAQLRNRCPNNQCIYRNLSNLLIYASKLPHNYASDVKIATLSAKSSTGLGHAGTEDVFQFLVAELSHGQPHGLIHSLHREAADAASHLSPQRLHGILKALTYIWKSTARNCPLRAAGPSGSDNSIQLRKTSLQEFDGWYVSYMDWEIQRQVGKIEN